MHALAEMIWLLVAGQDAIADSRNVDSTQKECGQHSSAAVTCAESLVQQSLVQQCVHAGRLHHSRALPEA